MTFHSSRFLSEQSRRPSTAFKKIFGRAFPTEATGSLNRKRVSIRGSLNRTRSMIVSDSSKQSKILSLVCYLIHVSRIFIDGPSPTYSKQSSIDEEEISHHSTPSGCEKKITAGISMAHFFDGVFMSELIPLINITLTFKMFLT